MVNSDLISWMLLVVGVPLALRTLAAKALMACYFFPLQFCINQISQLTLPFTKVGILCGVLAPEAIRRERTAQLTCLTVYGSFNLTKARRLICSDSTY
jgi:hypothetical protein